MEHDISKLVKIAMEPFYEMLDQLSQNPNLISQASILDSRSPILVSGLDSEVDSDSVVDSNLNSSAELGMDSSSHALVLEPDLESYSDSDLNPLGVSGIVCNEIMPDDSINRYSFLSQPPPASPSQFTLPPPPLKQTESRNYMVRNSSSTGATLISPFLLDTIPSFNPSDTDPPLLPYQPPKPPDTTILSIYFSPAIPLRGSSPPTCNLSISLLGEDFRNFIADAKIVEIVGSSASDLVCSHISQRCLLYLPQYCCQRRQ